MVELVKLWEGGIKKTEALPQKKLLKEKNKKDLGREALFRQVRARIACVYMCILPCKARKKVLAQSTT